MSPPLPVKQLKAHLCKLDPGVFSLVCDKKQDSTVWILEKRRHCSVEDALAYLNRTPHESDPVVNRYIYSTTSLLLRPQKALGEPGRIRFAGEPDQGKLVATVSSAEIQLSFWVLRKPRTTGVLVISYGPHANTFTPGTIAALRVQPKIEVDQAREVTKLWYPRAKGTLAMYCKKMHAQCMFPRRLQGRVLRICLYMLKSVLRMHEKGIANLNLWGLDQFLVFQPNGSSIFTLAYCHAGENSKENREQDMLDLRRLMRKVIESSVHNQPWQTQLSAQLKVTSPKKIIAVLSEFKQKKKMQVDVDSIMVS